jgi:hypothetical protein
VLATHKIDGTTIAAAATIGLLIYGKNKVEKAIKHSVRDMFIYLHENYGINQVVEDDERVSPEKLNKAKKRLNKYFGGNYVISTVPKENLLPSQE